MTQTIIGMTQLNVAKTSLCTTSFQSVVSFVRHCSSTTSSQLDSVERHEPCRRCLGNPKNTLASLYDVVKATAACSSAFFFLFFIIRLFSCGWTPRTITAPLHRVLIYLCNYKYICTIHDLLFLPATIRLVCLITESLSSLRVSRHIF